MNFTPGRTDFYAKLLRGCPGGRNERILVSKRIVKGTYFFVPDGRSLIQRILFTAGKLSGDAKAFNPLSEGEVLHEYNIAAVLSRFLYGELIFRLREASSGVMSFKVTGARVMFSFTVLWGNRLNCWNTMPIFWR